MVSSPYLVATPDSSTNTVARSYQTIKPRVGDVIHDGSFGEPWTGGSNLNPPPNPTYLTQHRPYKFAASQSLLTKVEAGIPEKLGTTGEDGTCSFEHWMRLQYHVHQKFGMDTPFYMPNPSWTSETNLFQCYNKTWPDVKPWIDSLRTGINHPDEGPIDACSFDIQNLEYSALFIKAS
jgi:hypothetical protein